MASGFGSALFVLGLGNGSAPATPDSGFRSMLAFWSGGAANAGEAVSEAQQPSGQGNWYKARQARYRWAEGYRKRKAELLDSLEEESVSAEVAGILEERESAAEEASIALDQGQDIFLRDALAVLARTAKRLEAMGIAVPAFDTEELDIVFVSMMMAAGDD